MLTTIKHHTLVPNDKQVVAFNDNDIAKVGFLKVEPNNEVICIHETGVLHKVNRFITVENLIKAD